LIHVAERARRIFGLDTELGAATAALGGDAVVGPLLAAQPGLRVAGTWDGFETGVRAILGQQVSVAGATTLAGRLVARLGTTVPGLAPLGLAATFPSPATVAGADLDGLGLTSARARAVQAFARAVEDDGVRLDGSVDLEELVASLAALPGIGPWTAHYLALRLGERDAFPAGDLALRKAFAARSSVPLPEAAEDWRPWRALAAAHLWAAGSTV
ncbi:MAG: 3-methyladenine DNA glycosylase 2, partial [Actinomycetota bacterium]|nr:3-methyladenine DNA glycosylase 2 [Actinomycetota bacterium]